MVASSIIPPVSLQSARERDLADGQPARVARDRLLDERLGVRAEDLPLAERREVHDRDLLRQAQYSAIAPSLSKQCGSQQPRYSTKLFVSSLVRGWKVVSW